ncbi:MAG TPA: NADH-quinone oxidoreductase subunit L, partial [Solirubrobacterales bacterium]|nr:NADH-quinone oxidoreductase subunit L [Solirubrobacterales bacterium]
MSATAWAWLVLLFPLLGSVVIGLGFRALPTRAAGAIGTAAIGLSFACGVAALINLLGESPEARHHASSLWDYASVAGLNIKLGIFVDPLSTFMVLVVSGVSTLIHLYSFGYMRSDEGYHRFFSYLNFFVFSMLLLVLAGNFVLLIVGWAFVGFASYALISFWYRRTTATAAGMKAFVINVVGDIGLVLAAFLIFRELGSFEYGEVFEKAPQVFSVNEWTITAICLLLLVGAFAKSAQLPLHTWLPDAMEGPTPVSALIHAATMVTAGVYLIARTHVLFALAPTAADIAAFTGLATLLVAATIALVMTDLKRAIAYSTMSQIGYMVVGVSIGAYSAGMFHLMTHAFFKALLFMAAGSLIAAMANEQNIDRMSGFGRAMRFTSGAMLCGALALAAFPLTSGFFSKDEILAYASARGGMYLIFTVLGYLGALLTAIYTFRLIFRVLPGRPCPEAQELIDTGQVHHAHPFNPATGEEEDSDVGFPGPEHHIAEHSLAMRIAMAVLAFGALFGGLIQVPGVDDAVTKFLDPVFEAGPVLSHVHPSVGAEWFGLAIGAAISLAGIGIAYYLYVARPETPAALQRRFSTLHTFLYNKWYFDEAIE